jgi:hypothetical protein
MGQQLERPDEFLLHHHFCLVLIVVGRSKLLPQKNLHPLKVKGHRIGLEEIVADHAGEAVFEFPNVRL